MKRLLFLLFVVPVFARAQNKPLVIEGSAPEFYVTHTVAAKENYYSIGRIYNVSPKEIAPFNKLVLENGLSLGQVIRIPLTANNFLQAGKPAADEALIPVYHTVSGKEGLYRVSVNYNKLPVETIRQWNNLKADAVSNGTNLVVGYLKVKKALSTLAGAAVAPPATIAANTQSVETMPKEPAKEPAKAPAPASQSSSEAGKEVAKETAKQPATTPAPGSAPPQESAKTKDAPLTTDASKTTNQPVASTATNNERKQFNGGSFKTDYELQTRDHDVTGEKGAAAVFKSTSGWKDGKYYCLHNASTPGTIVKITNNANGKSVYAKVLDVIPDIQQNAGLLVRVSNAAADELGAGEGKFDCSVSYSK